MKVIEFYENLKQTTDSGEKLEEQNLYKNELFQSYISSNLDKFNCWFFWETDQIIESYFSSGDEGTANDIFLLRHHIQRTKKFAEDEKLYKSYDLNLNRIEKLSELDILLFLTSERKKIAEIHGYAFHNQFPQKDLIFESFYYSENRNSEVIDLPSTFGTLGAKDLQQRFSPVNPVCLCTAIALALVKKSDHDDLLKKYIFSREVNWESLIDFQINDLETARLGFLEKERHLINSLQELSLKLMKINGTFKQIIPTIWHRRWAAWIAVNPNYIVDASFIRSKLGWTLYSYSMKINDRVHNFREKVEYEKNENKKKTNIALKSKNITELNRLLQEQKILELSMQKARDFYFYLPHEIPAHQVEVAVTISLYHYFSETSPEFYKDTVSDKLKEEVLSADELTEVGFDLADIPFSFS